MAKHVRAADWIVIVLGICLLSVYVFSSVGEAQEVAKPLAHINPANDCGCSRGDDAIPLSSGLLTPFLPKFPNLEFGFLYYFGKNVRTGRFSADYVRPFHLNRDSVFFGEAHAEGWDFWKRPNLEIGAVPGFTTTTSTASNRIDLSFGGGYRTMLGDNTFLGVNGFYDTSRLFNRWYSSGGAGLEYAAQIAGDDAIDLNFNWYGNLLNRDVLVNAFRNKGNSFDLEAGYSHALFNQALDLRLKLIGYQFDTGNPIRGWRGGADLTTRDGMFTVRYEYGSDRLNGEYNTVGGFVTVGFQLENLLSGESPFAKPEPLFRSPRDLRRLLGLKVKRNWHQPAAVVMARNARQPVPPGPCSDTLRGVVVLGPTLAQFVLYAQNEIPEIEDGRTAYLCWCNLINTEQNFGLWRISDGIGTYYQEGIIDPAGRTAGCAPQILRYLTPAALGVNGFSIVIPSPLALPLEFGPGGGLSIQFLN